MEPKPPVPVSSTRSHYRRRKSESQAFPEIIPFTKERRVYMNLRPQERLSIWRKRPIFKKKAAMTIAIGMTCQGGAIVAADTKIIDQNGSVTYGPKVTAFRGVSGTFAIANASDDANASQTLVLKLESVFKKAKLNDWGRFEEIIKAEMSDWSHAFRTHPPTQFIVSLYLRGRDGVGLYFCEPPITVLPKVGYISAGAGFMVADPVHSYLFGFPTDYHTPQLILRQISYLMYRVKKDVALCGGKTHGVYIRADGKEPEWVNVLDLEQAEIVSGYLDSIVKNAVAFALFSSGENLKGNADGLASQVQGAQSLRATVFHNIIGEEIRAAPIQ